MEASRDAGSIPAASIIKKAVNLIVGGLFRLSDASAEFRMTYGF